MTQELQQAKAAISETFQRMRLIEARHAPQIMTMRDGKPIETMHEVLQRAEARREQRK